MKIEIISYAVMGATSFPMYSGEPVLQVWEVATPVVGGFLISVLGQVGPGNVYLKYYFYFNMGTYVLQRLYFLFVST